MRRKHHLSRLFKRGAAVAVAVGVTALIWADAPATRAKPKPAPTTVPAPAPAPTTTTPTIVTPPAPTTTTSTIVTVPAPTTTTSTIVTPPATSGVAWGAATQGGPWDGFASLNTFEASAGKRVSLFSWYASFRDTDFPTTAATNVANRGAVPMITWEPWDPANGTANQPTYSLANIAGGAFDTYIRRWAGEIQAWGRPLRLRFAHEMNGDWYPWGSNVNGNTAAQYVAAWRHVHDLFAAAGATNVTWLWTPNVVDGMAPIGPLYPGDAYVDWVGVDGYNWGTTKSWSAWGGFNQVFGSSLSALRQLTARPIVIGETASTEVGGSKAVWIQDFFTQLRANPDIVAFIWFNLNKETDWRIESSTAANDAFRVGVADARYVSGA